MLSLTTPPAIVAGKKGGKKASKGKGPTASFDLELCPLDLPKVEEKISGQLSHLRIEYASIRTGEVSPGARQASCDFPDCQSLPATPSALPD